MIANNFDKSDEKRIENFLKMVYEVKKKNIKYDPYLLFMRSGLKDSDLNDNKFISTREYFDKWIERYKGNPNINVFWRESFKRFCQFVKGNLYGEGRLIKLYIPLDKEHLYSGAYILFDYIVSLGIEHTSKISDLVRSDDIVVRLHRTDFKYALKIIEFVNSNSYLKEGLNKTNPFVPTINGIGYVEEVGTDYSYNMKMAEYVNDYIVSCVENKKNPRYKDFVEYVITNCDLHDILDNFVNIVSDKKLLEKYFKANGRVDGSSYLNKNRDDRPTGPIKVIDEEKDTKENRDILERAIDATYQKYGINQTMSALFNGILGNLNSFTNSNGNYRSKLVAKKLSGDFILNYLDSYLMITTNKADEYKDIVNTIKKFVYYRYGQELVNKIDYISRTTLENHDKEQLRNALIEYYTNNDPKGISSFNKDGSNYNCREAIKNFSGRDLLLAIEISLFEKGIDTTGISANNMITVYSDTMENLLFSRARGM